METLKKFGKWLVAGLVAIGGGILVYLKLKEDEKKPPPPPKLPEPPPETTGAMHRAEGKAEAQKEAANTKATETKTELADTAKVDDGAARRKQLADLANKV